MLYNTQFYYVIVVNIDKWQLQSKHLSYKYLST